MSNLCRFPRPKAIAVSIAAAFCGLPLSAFSTPVSYGPSITLDANYSLGGALMPAPPGTPSGTLVDGMAAPPASISSNGSGADMFLTLDSAGNSVFFHTYGSSSSPSYFGARASGQGNNFYADTRSSYHTSVTNTSGVAQVGTFTFNVDYGEVGLYGLGVAGSYADLLLELRADTGSGAQVVGKDRTTILQTATGATCSDSDSGILGGYMSCGNAASSSAQSNGGPYSYGFNLAAGQTLTLDYDIIATVRGEGFTDSGYGYGTDCYVNGGDAKGEVFTALIANGEGGGEIVPTFQCSTFNAIARSGDPPFGFVNFNPTVTTRNAVPEPGSLALAALALGGLAAARRRKREKQL